MDIYLVYAPFQIILIFSLVIFAILSYKKPRFTALIFPVVLPFYLVKLYIKPKTILEDLGNPKSILDSIFSPIYQNVPVLRSDFSAGGTPVIPTNLLEILLLIFLIINWKLIWKSIHIPVLQITSYESRVVGVFLASIALLLFASVLSTIFAVNQRVALGAVKSWFVLPILLFFALLPLLKSQKFRQKFLYSIALSGMAVTLMSLPFILFNLYTYDDRMTGILLSPNHMAMAITPGLLALMILLFAHGNPMKFSAWDFIGNLPAQPTRTTSSRAEQVGWKLEIGNFKNFINDKVLYFLTYVLLVIEMSLLYLTYSYGAWIGLLAATILIISISSKSQIPITDKAPISKLQLKINWKLTLLFVTAIVIITSQLNNSKLSNIIHGNYYSSLHSRVMVWQSALALSRDRWLLGVGADNFQQAYLNYASHFKEPYIEWAVPMPHNIFLAFLVQLGAIGLMSFVLIIILTLTRIINPKSQTQIGNWKLKLDPLSLWAFLYLVYIIIHGLIDTPYFKNDLAIVFWLAIAAIWSLNSIHPIDRESRLRRMM